jgi:hypothetical protein
MGLNPSGPASTFFRVSKQTSATNLCENALVFSAIQILSAEAILNNTKAFNRDRDKSDIVLN